MTHGWCYLVCFSLWKLTAAVDCVWVLGEDASNRGASPRRKLLAPHCTRLQAKDVATFPHEDFAKALLEVSRDLKELHLTSLQLGDQRFEYICRIFQLGHHQALERLYLAHNNLGATGAIALAESLPFLPKLKVLNLPENAIRAQGAEALAKALPNTPLLEQLVLAGNGIGMQGAQAVAAALPKLTQLQDLHLSRNALGTQGALALARALHSGHGSALEWLSLNENALGDVGLQALATGFKRMHRLEWLDLNGNSLTDLGIVSLSKALCDPNSKLKTLRELTLLQNTVGPEGQKWLDAVKVPLPDFKFWTTTTTATIAPVTEVQVVVQPPNIAPAVGDAPLAAPLADVSLTAVM